MRAEVPGGRREGLGGGEINLGSIWLPVRVPPLVETAGEGSGVGGGGGRGGGGAVVGGGVAWEWGVEVNGMGVGGMGACESVNCGWIN